MCDKSGLAYGDCSICGGEVVTGGLCHDCLESRDDYGDAYFRCKVCHTKKRAVGSRYCGKCESDQEFELYYPEQAPYDLSQSEPPL